MTHTGEQGRGDENDIAEISQRFSIGASLSPQLHLQIDENDRDL